MKGDEDCHDSLYPADKDLTDLLGPLAGYLALCEDTPSLEPPSLVSDSLKTFLNQAEAAAPTKGGSRDGWIRKWIGPMSSEGKLGSEF